MENIDKIFFINLDYRKDRLEEFLKECEKINFPPEKIERYSGVRGIVYPFIGCAKSHYNVLKIAKDRGYKNVLIFEDDFEFLVNEEEFNMKLKHFFTNHQEFNVLMLSYYIPEPCVKVDDMVSVTVNAQTASGYIVNHNFFDKLLDCLGYGVSMLIETKQHWNYMNDQIWKKIQGDKWFHFTERIGRQRNSFSDITRSIVEYNI